ncbi:hypothetical protein Dimus_025796 [Dionaea muscipula]
MAPPPLGQLGLGQSLVEARPRRGTLSSPSSLSSENAVLSCPSHSHLAGNANRYTTGSISPSCPQPSGFNPGKRNHPGIVVPNFESNPYDQFAVIRNNTLAATYQRSAFTCANGASISADNLRYLLLARSESPALFALVAKMYNAYRFPDQPSSMQRNYSLTTHLGDRNNLNVGSNTDPSGSRQRTLGVGGGNSQLARGSSPGQGRRAPKHRSLPHPKHGPYTCPLCRKEFSTPPHFASHIGNYHDEAESQETVPSREPKRRRVDVNDVEPTEAGINLNLELGLNSFSVGESSSAKTAAAAARGVTIVEIS